jgi:hypothetical protein
MKTTKGQYRIMHANDSNKKINDLRFKTLNDAMTKLRKNKRVEITGINVDDTYTIISYEVRS